MTSLKRILLIDDSDTDNFIHQRRLLKHGVAREVVVRTDGRQALDYLTTPDEKGAYPRPDLLFLDIHMPVLDGWGFLEAYQKLPEEQRAVVTVAMLTNNVGERDHQRAYAFGVIDYHLAKPITEDHLQELKGIHSTQ